MCKEHIKFRTAQRLHVNPCAEDDEPEYNLPDGEDGSAAGVRTRRAFFSFAYCQDQYCGVVSIPIEVAQLYSLPRFLHSIDNNMQYYCQFVLNLRVVRTYQN